MTAVLAACLAGQAAAQPGRDQSLSRDQAAEQARARYGGKVLDVRPLPDAAAKGPGYRVKLLNRGEVRVIDVPAGPPRDQDNPRARPDR